MEDIPSLGLMKVSREAYEWCACDDGYVWSVTFMGLRGEVKTMTTISELTGPGATITEASVLRNSTEISGTFQLTYGHEDGDDVNHPDLGKKLKTRELAYDSDNEIMRIALEEGAWCSGVGCGVVVLVCVGTGARVMVILHPPQLNTNTRARVTCRTSHTAPVQI